MIMNIEKTISEHAVSDILTPMLESQDRIVTEDVAPLFNDATGLDTPPASGTVTTTIEESRSVITAIIRKAWTATLTMLGGASVIGYITAAYTYLRNRLQGDETYGIPDRRSEISASSPLAANLALLNDRKISGVNAEIPDGETIVRLLGGDYTAVTELTDNTSGWELNKIWNWSLFPNLQKLQLGCKKYVISGGASWLTNMPASVTEIEFTNAEEINGYIGSNSFKPNLKISAPRMVKMNSGTVVAQIICKEIYFPSLRECYNYGGYWRFWQSNDAELPLEKMVLGSMTSIYSWMSGTTTAPNLMHLEFGADGLGGLQISTNLAWWTATNCLDTEEHRTQFLSNFKTYIALRLTDNGSGKTLTLSQAVFSEIWDSQGQPQVKGDGLDELRADIHRIIRTDKQWAVNKA